jgi:hypothetical protein
LAIASALTHRVAIGLLADTPELGDLRLSIEVPPRDVLRSVHDSRHCRTWARGRAYVAQPVQHLRSHGYDATLLQPLAWRGVDQDAPGAGRDGRCRS